MASVGVGQKTSCGRQGTRTLLGLNLGGPDGLNAGEKKPDR
jgi:hypothetical protein